MTTDPPETTSTQSNGSPGLKDDIGAVSMIGLGIALRDVARHLGELEQKVEAQRQAASRRGAGFLEFLKILFSGWPAFALLFIVLFYFPLRDALNAIPDKVKSANEIGAWGVSLKSTIQAEAAKAGEIKLSESIPTLSSAAIELLLRAPRQPEALVSYSMDYQSQTTRVYFPSSSFISLLDELHTQGLVEMGTWQGSYDLTGTTLSEKIDQFRKQHPGTEEARPNEGRVTWTLNTPLPKGTRPPDFSWQLTDLGKKGVDVILRAVSTELAPKPKPASSP
jgi:hypothetical protein